MKKRLLLFLIVVLCSLPLVANNVQAQDVPEYVSPSPGATLVLPATTIAFRPGATINRQSLISDLFHVVGTLSGKHTGQVVLADDQRTVIFKPNEPFALGENVTVDITSGLLSAAGKGLDGTSFTFRITPHATPQAPARASDFYPQQPRDSLATPNAPSQSNFDYLTLPSPFLAYTVTTPANGIGDGKLFLAPFPGINGFHPYLLMLDEAGQPVYYKQLVTNTIDTDFKRQPNGLLTYFDGALHYYVAMDSSYNIVDTYQAGNGYGTDLHELQVTPGGHALLMAYDYQTIDMSQLAPGGLPTATVVGLIVQELDSAKNVVFQWRSWDHFNITDTTEPLTDTVVDYVHGNAIDLDDDGNLMISSRHMDEITK